MFGAGAAGASGCEESRPQVEVVSTDPASDFRGSCGSDRFVSTFMLQDGRQLAFSVEGDGVPVFALHGMSSSRLTWTGAMPLTKICPGVRLIAVDRPGYGGSSPPPAGYSYSAFVADIAELADFLQLEKFCVAGHSSGGPYALAMAAEMPSRVVACAAISSDPPYCHPLASMELRLSDSMSGHAPTDPNGHGGFYGRDPARVVEGWRRDAQRGGPESKKYAWQQGVQGWVNDFTLERIPWSFALERITLGSALTFWAGGKDYPPIMLGAPFMQGLVSRSQLRIVPGGGHSFKSNPAHLRDIFEELLTHWRATCTVAN